MTSEPTLSTFVHPNLETHLGAAPAVTYRPQSSSEPGQRMYVMDRLAEAPVRRTIHPRRRLGPVNPTTETTGTSRPETRLETRSETRLETRLETTRTSRDERRPDRSSLMWSRLIPSHWHVYKQDLMKLNPQTVRFTADAIRMLNGARLSVK